MFDVYRKIYITLKVAQANTRFKRLLALCDSLAKSNKTSTLCVSRLFKLQWFPIHIACKSHSDLKR